MSSTPLDTRQYHLWECASTARHPYFLLCAGCGARALPEEEDPRTLIFGACPGQQQRPGASQES